MDISIVLQEFVKRIEISLSNCENLSELLICMRKETDSLGLGIIAQHLEKTDLQIKDNPQRKKDWHVERINDKRNLLTEMGDLTFSRTYFKAKKSGEYRYLLDSILDIDGHQKLDKGYRDKLVNSASEMSYAKSGNTVGREKVSRQTVKRAVHEYDSDMIKINRFSESKKKAEYLYIDADEDHISLLGAKNGNQKCMYVYEGIAGPENRRYLVNPYYITGTVGARMFEEAFEYINNNYEFGKLKRIYIQGDGAPWIKNGLNIIPNSRFALDRFHMGKYVKKCTGQDWEMAAELWNVLDSADYDGLSVVMNELIDKECASLKEIKTCFKYFYNNFEGIEIYVNHKERAGTCSAEGHVSHLLSARLSSRPLTWSVKGADNIARLRVYKKNGGCISDIRKAQSYVREIEKKLPKYTNLMEKMDSVVYDKYHNIEVLNIGHKTELYKLLRMIRGTG